MVINSVIALRDPIDIDEIKSEISNSVMINHPRFSSLMVTAPSGRQRWKKTTVDIDRHITIIRTPISDGVDSEDAVNAYVAELSSTSPLSTDKPLWELHFLMHYNCIVFRIHHALGDGISLMALMMAFCRKADDQNQMPTMGKSANKRGERSRGLRVLWELVVAFWFTVVFVVQIAFRALWMRDQRTVISGGAGVEKHPRELATSRFQLEDMKVVKKAVDGATINDVLFGVISSGLSRYLDTRSSAELREGFQITGVAMVNVRKQPGLQELSELMNGKAGTRWGNKFGMMLLPVYYHKKGPDPLLHVKRVQKMLVRKKKSLEAHFSYTIGKLIMSCFGPKLATCLSYRIFCNTTFTISNVIGPQEEITVAGNPVIYLRAINSSLPNAITMNMMSYVGRADMQILVAKDIIPDPQFLAKCFEDALLEMKEASKSTTEV